VQANHSPGTFDGFAFRPEEVGAATNAGRSYSSAGI
jgi:hypothetical protein